MKRVKNKSGKGKRVEKDFALKLKSIFPSAETELKPRIINLKKDFWGLFDGLTFIKNKKKFIFWQIKSNKIYLKDFKKFWKYSRYFFNHHIKIILVEKNKKSLKIFYSSRYDKFFTEINQIKKII
ncbi:MAG: hypothetical protein NZ866_02735 [Patescibacteria group bacterium]|nr:hypothetical protein [Patescibacteria group bacterium]